MIDKLIDISLRYKILTIVFFILIVIFGFKSYKEIPIDAFPDITPKQVVIYTESPGNSAEDIEKLITYPIESAVSGMDGVKMIMSNSLFGLSYVSIFFEDDMDIYFLRQLVNERLNSLNLPQGWGKPELGPNTTGLGQVFWYQIYDKESKYSLQEIRQMQDYIVSPLFKSVRGVEEVIGWGGFKKQYSVLIDTKKLQSIDLAYSDIIDTLQKTNQSVGGQYLEFNKEQYLIRGMGLYKDLKDVRNTVIKTTQDSFITIGDIAKVEIDSRPRFGAVSIDGSEAVMGMVLQRTNTNAANVVDLLKQKVDIINASLPKDVKIKIIYDRTDITHKAVSTMSNALISGIILVSIILFLFLFELRSALIVIISLPVSLAIAFLLMDYYNISANLMSLSGLAIAIGMIVDGTIVVVENIFRNLNDTKRSKIDIILKSTKEVSGPVIFAILIIVVSFIPLLSLDGLAGKLYSPMAINIVFVMLGSLLVALVLIPVLSLVILKNVRNNNNILMRSIMYIYKPTLEYFLNHTKLILSIVLSLFISAIILISSIGREFMPSLNEESIMYRVIAIPGTSLTQSTQTAAKIEKYILSRYSNNVESVLSMIGRSEKGETAQANYMEVLLTLKDNIENLEILKHNMTEDLAKKFEYVQFIPTQPIAMRIEELLEGIQAELAIKIYGDNQKVLNQIANDIKVSLLGIKGLGHIEYQSQLGQAQIQIKPNYMKLARYGIEVSEIMDIIRYGVGEEPVTYMLEGIKSFAIISKVDYKTDDIESIKNITIKSKNGAMVSLEQVCDIKVVQGASFIKRENLSRYMVLSMEVNNRDIASFVEEAKLKIQQNVDIPHGYYISWIGDFKNMIEATNKLKMIIPFTLLIVFLLLFTAFNSISKALLILLNVPFALLGSIIALYMSGIYLSISAIVGFITIFAIAILNGIVLVSFIDDLRLKHPDINLKSLLIDAALMRLRPVLMTAFTTLFGILPLLYVSGVGSEIQYPLAVVVVGGIISSTILTLLILPLGYFIFFNKKSPTQ
jgi:cobalt-zinc-cadmium resistance protein CzcA